MKEKIRKLLKILYYLNFKTIYFNFKYFSFKQAIHLPIFISRNVFLKNTGGTISIQNEKIFHGMIKIGYGDVGIFDKKNSRTIWGVKGNILFKGEAYIGHGSKIAVGESGKLTFGERFTITAESTIICYKDVEFGDDCLLSWDILILDTDFHKIYSAEQKKQINQDKKIIVGNKCWIGCRTLILKGANISHNTIIAANSTVTNTKNIKNNPNTIWGGIPINILKENIYWEN